MSKYVYRSEDFSGSWSLVATVPDASSSYLDTGLDPAKSYLYRIVSASAYFTRSISNEKYMPWQYFTGSLSGSAGAYVTSKISNTGSVDLYFSASYTASYTGSMAGWVTGIDSSSIENYLVSLWVTSDVDYDTGYSSSLYSATMNVSTSYAQDYSGSFVGATTVFAGTGSGYYIQGAILTDQYYPTNNTTSLCYADINFSSSYTTSYTGLVSGSVSNLQSGAFSDYWVYPYRYAEGDQLYVFNPPGSASIDANGNWSASTTVGGTHILAKLYPKGETDISKPAAVAGFYPNGQYFNAGVNGYYVSSINSGSVEGNGFLQDLGRIQGYTGTKVGRLVRKSDGRIVGTSDNPIPYTGSWVLTTTSISPKMFKLFSTGSSPFVTSSSPIIEKFIGRGLLNSYWNTSGTVLNRRCFLYDQGVAIISYTNRNDVATAESLVYGAVSALTGSKTGSFPLSGSQWAFSANAVSSEYPDPYYRNGAQFWVAEGISHFLEKFPTASVYNSATQSLKNFWTTMFDYYWVGPSGSGLWPITGSVDDYKANIDSGVDTGYPQNTGSLSGSGLQLHSFLGGVGSYKTPEYTFTASTILPWASAEHNTDAYFALRSSARIMGDPWSSSLAASASLLGDRLCNEWWYASGSTLQGLNPNTESRAFQGISHPYKYDYAHALDVSTWHGLVLVNRGELGKFSASMATAEYYYLQDPNGTQAYGYTPYITKFYPAPITTSVWPEGTAGAILAWRAATSHSKAYSLYTSMSAIWNTSYGLPYATQADPTYEIGNSGSVTAVTWLMIADNPNGFWEVDF